MASSGVVIGYPWSSVFITLCLDHSVGFLTLSFRVSFRVMTLALRCLMCVGVLARLGLSLLILWCV